MPIDIYYCLDSPPSAIVLLGAKIIGVDLTLKLVDMQNGEHLKPEFRKINPQHTLPTIVDNGFNLAESRAILIYLQSQYGKDKTLYPADPKKQAIVNHRLNFDIGTLYARLVEYYYPDMVAPARPIPSKLKKIDDAFEVFDTLLDNSEYAAGDDFTLADISLIVTVSAYEALGYDISRYPNVVTWFTRTKKAAPGYDEVNNTMAEALKDFMQKPAI